MAAHVLDAFIARMQELRDLAGVLGLLSWDQETYMPPGGAEARAQHLGTLQSLYHERLTAPALGEAVAALQARSDLAAEQQAMVRNVAWERERAVRVPPRLVRELAERQSRSVEAWREARQRRDFRSFRPHLEALLALKREQADAFGHEGERYDALLEGFEPGMRVARLRPLFDRLQAGLVPLLRAIVGTGRQPPPLFAGGTFDADRQWALSLRLLRELGFDLECGRQDRSTHPFTGGAGHPGDVRLTTRLLPDTPISGLMSTIHEAGHGLYEQGFPREFARTSLAEAPSLGAHESQSRFWENVVGRSRPFWQHYFPALRESFPERLAGVGFDEFYRALNAVAPSLVRVEADEVTYNLHIVLRFELELGLLRGELEVADLPAAWEERCRALLGVVPADDTEGVLQDIHWAWGEFGYFPTYTLGNLYSAMLAARLEEEVPDVWQSVGRGELRVVLDWLRAKVHRFGHLLPAETLMAQATARPLSEAPFLAYLQAKYRPLYQLEHE